MAEEDILGEAAAGISEDWGLTLPAVLTKEAILALLADKVAEIVASGQQPFFQLMYKIDISEKKLAQVAGGQDVAHKIARLVYDRQLQKLHSRLQHSRNRKAERPDPDLEW